MNGVKPLDFFKGYQDGGQIIGETDEYKYTERRAKKEEFEKQFAPVSLMSKLLGGIGTFAAVKPYLDKHLDVKDYPELNQVSNYSSLLMSIGGGLLSKHAFDEAVRIIGKIEESIEKKEDASKYFTELAKIPSSYTSGMPQKEIKEKLMKAWKWHGKPGISTQPWSKKTGEPDPDYKWYPHYEAKENFIGMPPAGQRSGMPLEINVDDFFHELGHSETFRPRIGQDLFDYSQRNPDKYQEIEDLTHSAQGRVVDFYNDPNILKLIKNRYEQSKELNQLMHGTPYPRTEKWKQFGEKTLGSLMQLKDLIESESTEGYQQGGPVGTAPLDFLQPAFDPFGSGYDIETALEAGLDRDEYGHMGSLDPRTGMVLKGRGHESWNPMVQTEMGLGSTVEYEPDKGRFFAKPMGMYESAVPDETGQSQMNRLLFENELAQQPQYSMSAYKEGYNPAKEIAEGAFLPISGAISLAKSAVPRIGKKSRNIILDHLKSLSDIQRSKWTRSARKGADWPRKESLKELEQISRLRKLIEENM